MATAAVEAGDGKAASKGGKRKLLLILVPVLLVGAGAGGWFSGVLPRLLGRGEPAAHGEAGAHGEGKAHGEGGGHGAPAAPEKAEAKAPVFMDMPDIVANLNAGRRPAFIKLKAKFELSKPEDAVALQAAMPRIVDLFQSYLREMRPEELRGTAGTYRLREELIARTNIAAHPARVLNVLFTEMLVQ